MIDGEVHHFGAVGLSNGLAVLADKETRTYWDHITGEAFAGPLRGSQLELCPVSLTTVEAALALDPEISISLSTYRSLPMRLLGHFYRRVIGSKGMLPIPFRGTMHKKIDPRLPKLEQGLGVIEGDEARFYPMRDIPAGGLEDTWGERTLRIRRGELDHVPYAVWEGSEERPMQLLSRWYGFSFTYPRCTVYDQVTLTTDASQSTDTPD